MIRFHDDLLSWGSTMKTMSYYHKHAIPSEIENLFCEMFRTHRKGDFFFFLQDQYFMNNSKLTVIPFDTGAETGFDDFRFQQKLRRQTAGINWFDEELDHYESGVL
jgi:hypothetical protein